MWLAMINLMAVIICIPFYTLLERKILSYIQLRKGPKKVGVMGIMQPITDGVKLIIKEGSYPSMVNSFIFWVSPLFSFCLMLFSWTLLPNQYSSYVLSLSFLYFLCWSSMSVYATLGSGWGSNSKYSFLGAVRGASQSVSYEISLLTLMFFPLFLVNSYSLSSFLKHSKFYLVKMVVMVIFFFLVLCETNRSPFDFAEGESELVSGFKTEYSSLSFAFLFLGEYGNILFASGLLSILFFPNLVILLPIQMAFFSLFFLFVRGSFPRFRYDLLMCVSWTVMLPISLCFLFSFLVL